MDEYDADEKLEFRENPKTKSAVRSWIFFTAITVIAAIFVTFVSLYMFPITILLSYPLMALGVPYTIFVAIYAFHRRKTLGAEINPEAENFKLISQRVTFLLNIMLMINVVYAVIYYTPGLFSPHVTDDVVFVSIGSFAVVGGVASIFFNSPLIYNSAVSQTERFVIKYRARKWKIIRFSRILSWTVWSLYALIGTVVALLQLGIVNLFQ